MSDITSWGIPLLSAFGGATITVVVRELIEWYRRPRLIIDFERNKDEYPYIQDYNDESVSGSGLMSRIMFLRFNTVNKGKTTAYDCEAKMELIETRGYEHYKKSLHWSKRDPRIYKTLDLIYSPINLNRNDDETFDVLQLKYSNTTSDPKPSPSPNIETVSTSLLILTNDIPFFIKITVYARNTTSKPFYFKVEWDGTIQGFYKSFTKIKKFPREPHLVRQIM